VLGRFLELSLHTPDIRASLDFYSKLGFSPAEVGETWTHPYAVVTDGRICLGLHQQLEPQPALTFVKPNLLRHVESLERLGIEFEYRRLGNDVFNEVAWFDPSGHLIRCIEARTFSPVERAANEHSLCGYFVELALPAPDRAKAKTYWEAFGFVGMDEDAATLPHVACTSDTVDLGLYDPLHIRQPSLLFDVSDVKAVLATLSARGIDKRGVVPAPLKHTAAAVIVAPEGTPIVLAPGSAE
jgi:catechol 2,3-dioxygenase-like lactoylglutathione lyase family enzyme